jgi:Probable Zinc-ribbon domain
VRLEDIASTARLAGIHLTVRDAVDRGTCPTCDREAVTTDNALHIHRPDIIAQLHPTRNSGIDTTKLTVTSTRDLWWVCADGHPFVAPVLERVAGVACTVCYRAAFIPG